MIKLEANKMTKAIERAKAVRPRVRVINADARIYAVTGSKGDIYTVRFAVANGHKLAECDCPARGLCYHIAAAASVNIGIQSMRQQVAVLPAKDADASVVPQTPRVTRTVEADYTGVKVVAVRCNGWLI
ncbi:MAG TPA: hypothetical protein VIC84_22255 [Blastocatellia bacterium]|jgi:uncharacterized Zn finger protein